jgi:Co/Zn/Cd efflux system component
VVALFANLVVAAAKLVAGLVTGSAALLAEAAHSTADSVNELLLGLSLSTDADRRTPCIPSATAVLGSCGRSSPRSRRS